jgi:AAA15 family ATPase/GTPase
MKIKHLFFHKAGPLKQNKISLENDWTGEIESLVLFSGPNGCGKSSLLQTIAMLWDAAGYWLERRKQLPARHQANDWLCNLDGAAVVFDQIEPFYHKPIGLYYGDKSWVDKLKSDHKDIQWLGETITKTIDTTRQGENVYKIKKSLNIPNEDWIEDWSRHRQRMILTGDKVDGPNILWLDAEERRWVKPKRNIGKSLPEPLNLRWLYRYQATEDWKGQLEASLVNLKVTQLQTFHKVIRDLNRFLIGKEIEADIKPGENRLYVKIKNQSGYRHTLDWLSAGEHQVLILIYSISRWLQPGGVLLIDEPDLHLHPSLLNRLVSRLEHLAGEKNAQLIITSHATVLWQRYDSKGKRIVLGEGSQ